MGTLTDWLGLYKPAAGETGWGEAVAQQDVNANFDIIDALHTLPEGWFDLRRTLTHGGADNSSALQALVDSVPFNAAKAAAVFLWPPGDFVFGTKINWGAKSIRNVGTGSSTYSDRRYQTCIRAGANSMTIFEADGGAAGAHYFQGPTFEHMNFEPDSHTGVTALKLQRILRCRVEHCAFDSFTTGLELDENGIDCAWHIFTGNTFRSCTTGIHSTSSNHNSLFGGDFLNCTTGIHLDGITNFWGLFGFDLNMGSSHVGMKILGAGNVVVNPRIEIGAGTSNSTGIQIIGNATPGSQFGAFNEIIGIAYSDGSTGSTNTGVNLDANTLDNKVDFTTWLLSGTGNVYIDSGKHNRFNGGGYTDAIADRVVGTKVTAGVTNIDPTTFIVTISTGAAWKTIGTAT